ncbi:helix-turn-helix domain-containing protein [Sphingomonas sp. HITSZ_GF]|uniref:helix-turn-helix domain-containing protein n=1 Tax=Sphingomonas sp. HITSZ_GF TaxID=3037247 RepID=UPI00240DBEEE|nr:helix-turn-helix domain-containing protein [Sphingomonas sp. HITSZ_GF]MDG2535253.1 helix-turn-helix domain-containing protein [Sphingomonas sp. HITSZ_GF]
MAEREHWHVADAAAEAGISKPTLLRWIKQGKIAEAAKRDRNGWRLFDRGEVDQIKALACATAPSGDPK